MAHRLEVGVPHRCLGLRRGRRVGQSVEQRVECLALEVQTDHGVTEIMKSYGMNTARVRIPSRCRFSLRGSIGIPTLVRNTRLCSVHNSSAFPPRQIACAVFDRHPLDDLRYRDGVVAVFGLSVVDQKATFDPLDRLG